mmetsp:Transcript_112240/g.318227  ORF Transcript_112240/g.318227 Transcript_112240/m.318227 type:complete len:240 (-) Transcript_112240:2572-3291(-)
MRGDSRQVRVQRASSAKLEPSPIVVVVAGILIPRRLFQLLFVPSLGHHLLPYPILDGQLPLQEIHVMRQPVFVCTNGCSMMDHVLEPVQWRVGYMMPVIPGGLRQRQNGQRADLPQPDQARAGPRARAAQAAEAGHLGERQRRPRRGARAQRAGAVRPRGPAARSGGLAAGCLGGRSLDVRELGGGPRPRARGPSGRRLLRRPLQLPPLPRLPLPGLGLPLPLHLEACPPVDPAEVREA